MDNRIKVVHFLTLGEYAGAENVAVSIINHTKEYYNSVYVSPPGHIEDILRENGIDHYSIPNISVKTVRQAIKQIKPDVIHAHDFTNSVVAALAAGRIPIISHLHNQTSHYPMLR